RVDANVLASHLKGSAEAIYEVQTSPAHYYQRPDNDHVDLDPDATTLNGYAASVRVRRTSNNSSLRCEMNNAWRSAGFEINDLGYMRRADEFNHSFWAGYQSKKPVGMFRSCSLNVNEWLDWDGDGDFLAARFNINSWNQFHNNYSFYVGLNRVLANTSNYALRGGPASRWPGDWNGSFSVNSDHRRKLQVSGGSWQMRGDEDYANRSNYWFSMSYRPTNAIRVSFNPSLNYNDSEMQYIGTDAFGDEDRYLFGRIDQKTVSFTFRLDYCLTPNLTVQYYGSPFVSAGEYSEFKRITDPQADSYGDRFLTYNGDEIAYDAGAEEYGIDEDRDGTNDYSISLPDFNYRAFNSNLVVRWEYQPGSLLYLVWSQSRTGSLSTGDFDLQRDLDSLFEVHPHNVFLIKLNKWFSL
ncbi:MAG: DUF5916 domain-containing protein, partial [bacterium]